MFFRQKQLAYNAKPERPDPIFAKMLQEPLGGQWGEISVMMTYLFQGWSCRGPEKYRDMLLNTGTEEIGHIEMLSTAVAMNLEGAPLSFQEEVAANPVAGAVLNGMNMRHILSAGLAATPEDANGNPFNASHVYASGNIAGDMYSNVAAEATGRALAARLRNMTDDPGMKDMLGFLIARDTMHQQQWLAVIEELGGYKEQLPVPNSVPDTAEHQRFAYAYFGHDISGMVPAGRFTEGPSLDGKSQFEARRSEPLGQEPKLAAPEPDGFAQTQQMADPQGLLQKAINKLTP